MKVDRVLIDSSHQLSRFESRSFYPTFCLTAPIMWSLTREQEIKSFVFWELLENWFWEIWSHFKFAERLKMLRRFPCFSNFIQKCQGSPTSPLAADVLRCPWRLCWIGVVWEVAPTCWRERHSFWQVQFYFSPFQTFIKCKGNTRDSHFNYDLWCTGWWRCWLDPLLRVAELSC